MDFYLGYSSQKQKSFSIRSRRITGQSPFKVCKQLGIKIITNPKCNYDFAFFWDDKTYSDDANFPDIKTKNINRNCTDISKEKVDKVFAKVFGYDLSIDPLTYKG
ncbi:MAG: hypothetical protein U5K00_23220 [Melioribacteraceae bacterium]|nr:hypothetical protein [Melioribacteraceae bacterium]